MFVPAPFLLPHVCYHFLSSRVAFATGGQPYGTQRRSPPNQQYGRLYSRLWRLAPMGPTLSWLASIFVSDVYFSELGWKLPVVHFCVVPEIFQPMT